MMKQTLLTVIDKEVEEQDKSRGVTLRPAKKIKFRQRCGERVPYIELFGSNDIVLPIGVHSVLRIFQKYIMSV